MQIFLLTFWNLLGGLDGKKTEKEVNEKRLVLVDLVQFLISDVKDNIVGWE